MEREREEKTCTDVQSVLICILVFVVKLVIL